MREVPKDEVIMELQGNCNPKIILVLNEKGKNYLYDNEDLVDMPFKDIAKYIDSKNAIFLET